MKTKKKVSRKIERELFNPHLLDEILSAGEMYDEEIYDDLPVGFDCSVDEMSFDNFNAVEEDRKSKKAPLYLKQDPFIRKNGGLSPLAA